MIGRGKVSKISVVPTVPCSTSSRENVNSMIFSYLNMFYFLKIMGNFLETSSKRRRWSEHNQSGGRNRMKKIALLQVHKSQPGRQTGDSKYANDNSETNFGYVVIGIATSLPNWTARGLLTIPAAASHPRLYRLYFAEELCYIPPKIAIL